MSDETSPVPDQRGTDSPENGDRPFVEPETPPAAGDDGVLRVTTGSLQIPEGIVADDEVEKGGRSLTALLVIIGGAVAFILFIAWLIAEGAR